MPSARRRDRWTITATSRLDRGHSERQRGPRARSAQGHLRARGRDGSRATYIGNAAHVLPARKLLGSPSLAARRRTGRAPFDKTPLRRASGGASSRRTARWRPPLWRSRRRAPRVAPRSRPRRSASTRSGDLLTALTARTASAAAEQLTMSCRGRSRRRTSPVLMRERRVERSLLHETTMLSAMQHPHISDACGAARARRPALRSRSDSAMAALLVSSTSASTSRRRRRATLRPPRSSPSRAASPPALATSTTTTPSSTATSNRPTCSSRAPSTPSSCATSALDSARAGRRRPRRAAYLLARSRDVRRDRAVARARDPREALCRRPTSTARERWTR